MNRLPECIIELFTEVLKRKDNIEYLKRLAETRGRNESWLRGKVIRSLKELVTGRIIEERYYPKSYEKCDVFFEIEPYEFWMEIKTLPTNYCGGGGKPITEFISEVCNAIGKLWGIRNEYRRPLLLALFYPFCGGEREVEEWDTHLSRIFNFCDRNRYSYEIRDESVILENGVEAKAYFVWR